MQEKGQAEFDPMTETEISSILDSELPPDEKFALLASYLSEDDAADLLQSNMSGTSSDITVQVQEESDEKKGEAKNDAPPEEIKAKASSSSSGVELQEKNKHADETNAKEEHDSDKESASKESSLSHPSSQQEKGEHTGAMAKEEDNDHLHCKDVKSELQDGDKSLSHHSSQQEKIQHTETEVKRDVEDQLPSDDRKLRKIDECLSHSSPPQKEQSKVDPNHLKLTSDEKSQPLVCDRIEVDGPSSKLNSSGTSSRIEFKEKDHQHVEMEGKDEHDSGPLKWIDEAGSSFRSQRVHVEDSHVSLELKQEFVVARVEEPQNNKGEEDETIHKEEAICKYCFKYMINEENVLKAKCKCKLTLIHEECATKWSEEKGNKCTACDEEIRNIHVTIVMASSFTSQTDLEKHDKPTSVSTRCWSCLFNF